jgi:hypothetical protein
MSLHDRCKNKAQSRYGRAITAAAVLLVVLLGCTEAPTVVPLGTLPELDQNSYAHQMEVLAHHFPGANRPGKMQMMAIGDRRYLFQLAFPGETWDFLRAEGQILDVTDPLAPKIVNRKAFNAFSINLAWHAASRRWILMESRTTFGDPARWAPGLRGVRFLDVTDPTDVHEISKYSTDGGDPSRFWQEGSGTHRDWWDGGRYAYLGAAGEDAYFPERGQPASNYSRSLQILDLESLESPKLAANWWVPGQKRGEKVPRDRWRSHRDRAAYDSFHGPEYVPRRVEDGGRYGYGGWGTFGVLIHDLSNPLKPKLVGRWDTPEYQSGPMMPHHTVDVTRLDRGFVITSPESMVTECQEAWHDSWVLDVRDPAKIRPLAKLPKPRPPEDAPYDDFCRKRGRFGPHNAPHLKAPGRPHPDFTLYTYFNGGLQGFDLSDPSNPRISAWFVPPQGGRLDSPESFERGADSVFVEWDRKLIWLATNNGLYLLSAPALGQPILEARTVSEWSLENLNAGHP